MFKQSRHPCSVPNHLQAVSFFPSQTLPPAKMASYLRVLRCIINQPAFSAPRVDMSGKTVVLTGPTQGGIGFETAKALASFGAHLILGARNLSTASEAADAIRSAVPSSHVDLLQCDLAQLDSVQVFAEGVRPLAPHGVDVLVCNAGAVVNGNGKTAEGVNLTFAVCALGHHKLVHLMKPSRLVWVSGDIYAIAEGKVDPFEELQGEPAYFQACLGRMLLAREWKKRAVQREKPMEVVAVHPGVINSEFNEAAAFAKWVAGKLLIDTQRGAQASILAASAPSSEIRQEWVLPYYHNKRGWFDLPSDDLAMNEAEAARLFEKCNEICGTGGGSE